MGWRTCRMASFFVKSAVPQRESPTQTMFSLGGSFPRLMIMERRTIGPDSDLELCRALESAHSQIISEEICDNISS